MPQLTCLPCIKMNIIDFISLTLYGISWGQLVKYYDLVKCMSTL